jgi:hypothetical protein
MGGALLFVAGLVSSAIGAAVAGLLWVAVAVGAAAIPYLVIGALRAVETVRARHSRRLAV